MEENQIVLLGCVFTIILLMKTLLYYRLRNPDGSMLQAQISGEMGFYLLLAFLPVRASNYPERKRIVKWLNYLTYSLYVIMIVLFTSAFFNK